MKLRTFSTNALAVAGWDVVAGGAQAQSVDAQSTAFAVIRLAASVLVRLSCKNTDKRRLASCLLQCLRFIAANTTGCYYST